MIGDGRGIALTVDADQGMASSSDAVSLGLIVTELVINALKHAFADGATDGSIKVSYELADPNWRLTAADNGLGKTGGSGVKDIPGLGTSIVNSLARQLGAYVDISTPLRGRSVAITHGVFKAPIVVSAAL
jgi:two-component sensor histidine kinase